MKTNKRERAVVAQQADAELTANLGATAVAATDIAAIVAADASNTAVADATTQSGIYVQADVQSLRTLANDLKVKQAIIVTLVNELKTVQATNRTLINELKADLTAVIAALKA